MITLGWYRDRRRMAAAIFIPIVLLSIIFFWLVGRQTTSPPAPEIPRDPTLSKSADRPETGQSQLSSDAQKSFSGEQRTLSFSAPGIEQINADPLPPLGDRIIKSASLTVKVKRGKFDEAFNRAVMVAQANGGYVAASSSSAESDNLTSGSITIRIPASAFEKAATELKRLGKVKALNIQSQDVSEEYVDLESRLRHWRSQESILLNLMQKAQTIGDSIAVQNQLSQIQQQIEQITGRLNFLKNQTELSTIELTITETGFVPRPLADRWGFKTALNRAAHAFVDTINGFIIVMGYLIPVSLIGVLIYAVFSLLRRRLAGATATSV